jgi:iron complex transport system ATP-binding protein
MAVSVSQAAVAARGLSVRLGGVPVLKSVSFEARPGEIAGLIGPNGAGKSTLLRALAGLIRPNSGDVHLGDVPLKGLNAGERARRIAFMPQHDAMHPFTALETVLMGRYAHLGRFELEGSQDRRIAREAMTQTDTTQFENRQLDRLSGGERQRVILARALAQQAGIILLDEPSASLDLRHRLSVMETLRAEAVGRQVAVVVALHDVSLAGRYCDRLVLLSEGVIVADGRPANVLTPANLRNVFGVETVVQLDPATGYPQIWLIGPAQ